MDKARQAVGVISSAAGGTRLVGSRGTTAGRAYVYERAQGRLPSAADLVGGFLAIGS